MSMSRPSPQHQLQQPQPPLPPPPQPPFPATRSNLELTIISAKHLKNVNWKNGDLKPYVIFWVHPDHKLTTKSDDSGNTKPVWNQRFLLPITSPLSDAFFSLEIFHSKTSETPKPFVGSLQFRLSSLIEPDNPNVIRTFDVLRPSGRPQGKIRLKLAIKEQPLPQPQQHQPPPPPPPQPQASSPLEYDYQTTPHPGYYYSSAPPYPYNNSRSASPAPPPGPTLPPPTAYPYSMGYYSGGYYPTSGGSRSYGAPPSAPVDYSQFDQRSRTGSGFGVGVGTGLAVGSVAGALGGIALDEGLRYEEGKITAERVEDNYVGTPRDDFSDYRAEF